MNVLHASDSVRFRACFVAGMVACDVMALDLITANARHVTARARRRKMSNKAKWYLVMKDKRLVAGFSGGLDPLISAIRCAERNGGHIIIWEQ